MKIKTIFSGTMLLLLSLFFVIQSSGASEMVDSADREIQITGHFISPSLEENILLRGSAIGNEGDIRLLSQSNKDDPVAREIIDSTILNEFERTELMKVCRDPDSGLDQMIFSRSNSGTAWGDRKNILFVYYDRHKKRYATADFEGRFVDDGCSLKAVQRRIQNAARRHEAGVDLYQKLQPKAAVAGQFVAKPVDFNFNYIQSWFAELNRATMAESQREEWSYIDEANLNLQVMTENDHWRIVAVYFEESVDTSWGVLLRENKLTGSWVSFYDVPNEGSSKRYLFLPDQAELDGDNLHINLCTDCSWWGKYSEFKVDLESFEYEAVKPKP